MIVFAVIAILAVIVAWAGGRYRTDAKIKQTHAIMDGVMGAYAEWKLVNTSAPPQPYDPDDPADPFTVRLPPGSDQYRIDYFREPSNTEGDYTVEGGDPPARGETSAGSVAYSVAPSAAKAKFSPDNRRIYGIQALYYYLVREPNSKRVLEKLPAGSLASPDRIPAEMGFQQAGTLMATGLWNSDDVTLPARVTEVRVIVDAWGRPMHYDRDVAGNNNQPALRSAGPDGIFNEDDIWSHKR